MSWGGQGGFFFRYLDFSGRDEYRISGPGDAIRSREERFSPRCVVRGMRTFARETLIGSWPKCWASPAASGRRHSFATKAR